MKKAMMFAGAAALGAAAMGRRTTQEEADGRHQASSDAFGGGSPGLPEVQYQLSRIETGIPLISSEFTKGYKYEAERLIAAAGGKRHLSVADYRAWSAKKGSAARGRRAATRRRTYKTLAGLQRAMGDRGQLSLETIFSERANIKGVGWTPIRYTLTDEDISEIATMLGGRERTQDAVANGLRDGRLWRLPYSTRQRITWDKYGWGYIGGQDYRAETARIRKLLKN